MYLNTHLKQFVNHIHYRKLGRVPQKRTLPSERETQGRVSNSNLRDLGLTKV